MERKMELQTGESVPDIPDDYRREVLRALEVDEVTEVYTKQAFVHHVKKILDRNPETKFDVVVSDIENFRLLNSIYGNSEGDAVLLYLAEAFRAWDVCRVCGRYGADQFVILTESVPVDDALLAKLEEIRKNAPIPYLTLKYGINQEIDRSDTIAQMCDKAVLALKSIKHTCEKPVALYDAEVILREDKDRRLEADFERAIGNGEFVVWCQPKFDAFTEKMTGAEALIRWINGDGVFTYPGDFIRVFEGNGYIVRLDEYVFRCVCREQKKLLNAGMNPVPISVNLSRTSLFHPTTISLYHRITEEEGVPKHLVPIELTESAAIDSVQIQDLVRELKQTGFVLHMDDFGSGYSSLSSLSSLPFDVVKLDKSLIDDIGNKRGDEILRHIIELAHFCNMGVVAEGVEEGEQFRFLQKLGCDTIQGYYFSKPIPFEGYTARLREERQRSGGSEREKQALADEIGMGSLKLTSKAKEEYLSALGSIYMTMHVVDLLENTIIEFATTTNVKKHVNRVHDAASQIKMAMRATVAPEDVEAALVFTDLATLPARMRGKRRLTADFRGVHFACFQAQFIVVTANAQDEPEKILCTTQVIDADSRHLEGHPGTSCRTDELTGVYNLDAFEEDVQSLSDSPGEGNLVLLFADIDNLKYTNDTAGHMAGDELLWGAAECLTDEFGSCGKVYRVGGDEFVVMFHADEETLEDRLTAFRDRVRHWMGNQVRQLSLTYGVSAEWEFPGLSVKALLEETEQRMYRDKMQ